MIKVIAITKQTIFLEKIGLFFQPAGIQVIAVSVVPMQGMKILASKAFDVALVDINWHDKESPSTFEKLVSVPGRTNIARKTIGMATFYSEQDLTQLTTLGVGGYFVRTIPDGVTVLINSIKAVSAGGFSFPRITFD